VPELCRICETRRPRRTCPGVGGDICSPCCGAEREITVDCPLDCEYLIEARRHEKAPELKPEDIPNGDIRVTEQFLDEHNDLLIASSGALFAAAAQVPGVIDYDVREALEALIKTYRTRESGLIYESRPPNPLAAGIQQFFEQQVREYREASVRQAGLTTIRDAEILGVLVFLQRMERQFNNGRRRGRAFLDFLRRFLPSRPATAASNIVTA
jgi:hypothetical protein